MDTDIFGERPKTPVEEAWHNEQRRKEYDVIRVSNPATITVKGVTYNLPPKDFYIMYDTNQHQKVPFNSTIDVPRPRAERYIKHKKDEIVNFINQKMHDEYLADRDQKGLPRYTDKHTENKETYETQQYPKTDDEAIIAEIYDQLWLGITIIAGRDIPPVTDTDPRSGEVDMKPKEVKALDVLNKKIINMETDNVVYTATPDEPYKPPTRYNGSSFSKIANKLNVDDVTA